MPGSARIAVQTTVENNLNSIVIGDVTGDSTAITEALVGTAKWPTSNNFGDFDRFTIEAHSAGNIAATKQTSYINGAFAFASNNEVSRDLVFGTGSGASADSDNG